MQEEIQDLKGQVAQITDMLRTMFEHQQQLDNCDQQLQRGLDIHDPRRTNIRSVRLEFPHFEGENAAGWVFKAN